MPGIAEFKSDTTVIGHTAALDIQDRHRNVEFSAATITKIIFDIKFERLGTG